MRGGSAHRHQTCTTLSSLPPPKHTHPLKDALTPPPQTPPYTRTLCAMLTVLSSVGTLLLIMEKLLAAHSPILLLLVPASCSLRIFLIISPIVCVWGGGSSRGKRERCEVTRGSQQP